MTGGTEYLAIIDVDGPITLALGSTVVAPTLSGQLASQSTPARVSHDRSSLIAGHHHVGRIL